MMPATRRWRTRWICACLAVPRGEHRSLSSPVAAQHLRELAAGKSKIYELLLALEQNPQADDSCWQSLAGIVDRALFNEISLDSATLRDLGVVVSKTPDDLGSTLAALDAALSEGERLAFGKRSAEPPAWIPDRPASCSPQRRGRGSRAI